MQMVPRTLITTVGVANGVVAMDFALSPCRKRCFRFSENCLTQAPNQWFYPAIPPRQEGRTRDRHDTRGGDAVAAVHQALLRDD